MGNDDVEANVSGEVTSDSTGDPIEGAAVSAFRTDGNEQVAEATTGTDGSYDISFTVAGENTPDELRLEVGAEGFVETKVTVDFSSKTSRDFTLDVATTEIIPSGTITNAGEDNPIEGATVTGTRPDTSEQLFETTTGSDGRYETSFEVADEPNEIEISADADGFETGSETVVFSGEITADFALTPSTTQATTSGTVTNENTNDPIEDATVTGTRPDNSEQLFETATGPEGTYEANFEVDVIDQPEEVEIRVKAQDYDSTAQTVGFAEQLEVDFTLDPETVNVLVDGTITSEGSGDPISEAAVEAFSVGQEGSAFDQSTSASDGTYELSFTVNAPQAPAELQLKATAESFEERDTTVSFTSSIAQDFNLARNRFSLELSLDGEGSINTSLVSGDLNGNGYLLGSEIEVEVSPDGDDLFFGWTGDIGVSENPTTVEITEDIEATAEVGPPQEGLSLGIGFVRIGSTIDQASFSLSNDLSGDVIVTGFTLLNENDQEVVSTSENLTIVPGDSGGFSVDFALGPTPGELEQYETVWEFEFGGSTFVKEVVVGDVFDLTNSVANGLEKSENIIEMKVEK